MSKSKIKGTNLRKTRGISLLSVRQLTYLAEVVLLMCYLKFGRWLLFLGVWDFSCGGVPARQARGLKGFREILLDSSFNIIKSTTIRVHSK